MTEKLRAALAAEHAALYAYGRLGILLDATGKAEAHLAEASHRARRDALVTELDRIKSSPVPAEAAYALPFPLTDRASALRLAVQIEDAAARVWRAALASTDGELRKLILDGYSGAAVSATRWRKLSGVSPLTSLFPARPT